MTARKSARGWLSAWMPVVVYFIATSLGHLEFSLWLVRQRTWGGVTFAFKDAMPWLAVTGAVALFAWIVAQMRKRPHSTRAAGAFWAGWCLCVLLNDRFLTYSVNEYAHYPQYALLAWLVARALDPRRRRWMPGHVIFWTSVLGMADELQQYLWIAPSYGHYLDFNDFLVNLVAAAAGTMLYYCSAAKARACAPLRPARIDAALAVALAIGIGVGLAVAVGFAMGMVAVSPPAGTSLPPGGWLSSEQGAGTFYLQRAAHWYQSWQTSVYRERYFVLPPWVGLVLMAACGGAFTVALHAPRLKAPAPEAVGQRFAGEGLR
jgi:hypothetical protein